MKPRNRFVVCALALLFMSGTGSSQAAQPEAGEAARTMAALVAEFRDGATLAEWRRAHPEDRVAQFEINQNDAHLGADTDWCARASTTVRLADGRAIERTAYFYVPEREAEQTLPAQDSDPELIFTCRLGHLWVETAEQNADTATALARRLRVALQGQLGAADPKPQLVFLGSAAWEQIGKWKSGQALVLSAYDKTIGGSDRKRVIAFATTAVADKYGFNFGIVKGFDDAYGPTRELLRQVERVAGLEQQAAAIEEFLDATNPHRPGASQQPCGSGTEVVAVLTRWIEAAKQWDAERHAPALLVADLTMVASQACYQSPEDATRTRLKALGAGLEYSPLGASWEYTRTWLRDTVQAPGRIGEMAFVEWMRTGFREGCCCQGESPERVIKEGEAYLQQKRAPETEARVHFMLGDAYRDIVGLAGGAGQEYGSPEIYQPQAPRARQQAIAHYRAGLKLDSQSEEAQHAWATAWRLIAGLATSETRYFCVYD